MDAFKRKIINFNNMFDPCLRGIFYFFLYSTVSGVFYFFSLYFHTILHYPINQVGILIASYSIGAILGGFIGGRLSDLISASTIAFFSCLIHGILFFLFKEITNIYCLFAIIFSMGLMSNAFIAANNTWVLEKASERKKSRARIQSLSAAGSNLGLASSALLASFLIPYGYPTLFLVVNSGFFILAFVLFFDWYFEKNKMFNTTIVEPKKNSSLEKIKIEIHIIFVTLFFVGIVIAQMSSTYSVYLHDQFQGRGEKLFSYLFILNTLIVVFFQHPITILFEKVNHFKIISFSGILLAISFIFLITHQTINFLILSMIFYTIGEILFFTFSRVICYELAPSYQKGMVQGFYRSIFAASRVFGAYITGLIYHYKGASLVFLFCIICSLAAIFIPLFKKNSKI